MRPFAIDIYRACHPWNEANEKMTGFRLGMIGKGDTLMQSVLWKGAPDIAGFSL